ncbi:PhzF family phenazine biosynthesis protein [Paracoccaceae bacterium]|nr:PhzF family phenazine biosynthesis protein [Paracoccaceae bacterium]
MTLNRRFIQCDVFSNVPTKGNGLAVVNDADDLSTEQMQSFAAWTNLAETTFILKPDNPAADYRLRIFTPSYEMSFAGHPTLGSCKSWQHWGGIPKQEGVIIQQCEVGLIEIRTHCHRNAFIAPLTQIEPLTSERLIAVVSKLGISQAEVVKAALLTNGPVWNALELVDAEAVLAIEASGSKDHELGFIGIFGRENSKNNVDYEVRMLEASDGMTEDPITGSLNAALAKWLFSQHRIKSSLIMSQGQKIGRQGRVYIDVLDAEKGAIKIGGEVNILIEGHVLI